MMDYKIKKMRSRKRLFPLIIVILWSVKLVAQVNAPTPVPDRIIINPGENPYTTVAVNWRTDTSVSEGFCEYMPAPEGRVISENVKSFRAATTTKEYNFVDKDGSVEPTIQSNHHSYVINGLESGQRYIYRVGAGENWSEWFEFIVPTAGEKISFIYFGDPQVDLKSQFSRIIRSAYRHHPDCAFMVYAGDLINRPGRDIEWDEWFYAGSHILATVPQMMTPGNHDYKDAVLDPHWNAQFTLPANGAKGVEGSCYYVDYQNLRFISIDTGADYELRKEDGLKLEAQKQWLTSILESNTKKWVILTTHLPFYSPKQNRDNEHIRKHFQPILEKYNVDLVLTGHDHSYARGRASDNPQEKHPIMYVVSVSGPKLSDVGDKEWMEFSGEHKQLYQIITIDNNKLNYESYAGNGSLFDRFSIKKSSIGKNKFR